MNNSEAEANRLTAQGIPIRNLWHMLLYAWGELPHTPFWQQMAVEDSPSLDGLLARVLTQLLRQRLRIGLGRSYMREQHLLRGIRGRVQFTRSLQRRAFERGQAVCTFEQYSLNARHNQIIRSTLHLLGQVGEFGPYRLQADALRHSLRLLVRLLEGIELVELTTPLIRREQLKRHDRDYRIMLAVCDLVVQRRLPTEDAGQVYMSELERERFVLHRLYERFVANFYRHHLTEWRVQRQKTLAWHETPPAPLLPVMRPDLVLVERSTNRMVILDTKFTANSLHVNQWGQARFSSPNLYQMYAYLQTQAHLSESHRRATGILLYPAVGEALFEKVQLRHHQLCLVSVDLAAAWEAIEAELLALIRARIRC